MQGYRSEEIFGEGYREAVPVMGHEMFELENSDIPDTLSRTIFQGTPLEEKLRQLASYISGDMEEPLDAPTDEEQIEIVQEILRGIKVLTGKEIRYVLWLCDSIEDVVTSYGILSPWMTEFDVYEVSDVVLSDDGEEGKLYGFEKLPEPVDFISLKNA